MPTAGGDAAAVFVAAVEPVLVLVPVLEPGPGPGPVLLPVLERAGDGGELDYGEGAVGAIETENAVPHGTPVWAL